MNMVKHSLVASGVLALCVVSCTSDDQALADPSNPVVDSGRSADAAGPAPTTTATADAAAPDLDAAVVPPPDSAPSCASAPTGVGVGSAPTGAWVVSYLSFGDFDLQRSPDADAWQEFGENIDGKETPRTAFATSPFDHCTPFSVDDAPTLLDDGPGGIDNSFAKNVLPGIAAQLPPITPLLSSIIDTGGATFLIRADLPATPPSPDPVTVQARLYNTAPLGLDAALPTWDGSDVFPIDQEWLTGSQTDIDDAVAFDPNATFTCNTLRMGPLSEIELSLTPELFKYTIPLRSVVVTMHFDETRTRVVRGTMTGTVETATALGKLLDIISFILPCNSAEVAELAALWRRSQDIMVDRTNDPGAPCNAVSMGIGFTGVAATPGQVQNVIEQPNQCTPP